MKTTALYDLNYTIAADLLERCEYPWEALSQIHDYVLDLGSKLPDNYTAIAEDVWVEKTVTIHPTASIQGPCIIGAGTEVRPGAFIRGNVIVGSGCVVGNSTELKNCILFDGVQVPHYNYIGDSVLGHKAHFGAGALTSNIKNDKTNVTVIVDGQRVNTGLRKFGAMVGDGSEIGCHTVCNPGTIIGQDVSVYPLSSIRGTIPSNHIYKDQNHIVPKES